MIYAFILGSNATLSVAEILRKLSALDFSYSITSITRDALVLNGDFSLDSPLDFLNKLGGTVKILKVEKTILSLGLDRNSLKENLSDFFVTDSRLEYGISTYGFNLPELRIVSIINAFGLEMKKNIKLSGSTARYVALKEPALTSVQVNKNELIKKGFELVLINTPKGTFIGKTLAVQNFESYNFRDFCRPKPDPASGMLPPKVSQIMVNLVGLKPEIKKTIYDPFCGSGTIIQEALLLGFSAFGSDNSEKAVSDSRSNIGWLIENFHLPTLDLEKQIFLHDITDKVELDISAIVTEPYLGPALRDVPLPAEKQATTEHLADLYNSALHNMHSILPDSGAIIMIFPNISGSRTFLKVVDYARKIGYDLFRPIEKMLAEEFKRVFKELNPEGTINYSRPDAKVIREIAILVKTNRL